MTRARDVADRAVITTADLVNIPSGAKNLIINGDMRIAQRGTSASITSSTTGAGVYNTVDRWNFYNDTSVQHWDLTQDTDVPTGQGFSTSLKIQCATSSASLGSTERSYPRQLIEAQNLQHLAYGTSNAESLTLSFWVKSNKTGTYIFEIYQADANRQISKSYTIDSANTWEKKTITIEGDTSGQIDNNNQVGFYVDFWLTAGSNYSSGTLNTSWNGSTSANRAVGQVNLADSTSNYINITGVQLEVGEVATEFEHRPYDTELARCQRYCYKNKSNGAYPVFVTGVMYNSTNLYGMVNFPVAMRITPNSSFSDASHFQVVWGGAGGVTTNIYISGGANNSARMICTSSTAGTVGHGAFLQAAGTQYAWLLFDAEL